MSRVGVLLTQRGGVRGCLLLSPARRRKAQIKEELMYCLCRTWGKKWWGSEEGFPPTPSNSLGSQRRSLIFPFSFSETRSAAEIKPLTESPLAVDSADRIRFNAALSTALREKVRNGCLTPRRRRRRPSLCLAADQK